MSMSLHYTEDKLRGYDADGWCQGNATAMVSKDRNDGVGSGVAIGITSFRFLGMP